MGKLFFSLSIFKVIGTSFFSVVYGQCSGSGRIWFKKKNSDGISKPGSSVWCWAATTNFISFSTWKEWVDLALKYFVRYRYWYTKILFNDFTFSTKPDCEKGVIPILIYVQFHSQPAVLYKLFKSCNAHGFFYKVLWSRSGWKWKVESGSNGWYHRAVFFRRFEEEDRKDEGRSSKRKRSRSRNRRSRWGNNISHIYLDYCERW